MTDRVAELRRAAGLPDRVTDLELLERLARVLSPLARPVAQSGGRHAA